MGFAACWVPDQDGREFGQQFGFWKRTFEAEKTTHGARTARASTNAPGGRIKSVLGKMVGSPELRFAKWRGVAEEAAGLQQDIFSRERVKISRSSAPPWGLLSRRTGNTSVASQHKASPRTTEQRTKTEAGTFSHVFARAHVPAVLHRQHELQVGAA